MPYRPAVVRCCLAVGTVSMPELAFCQSAVDVIQHHAVRVTGVGPEIGSLSCVKENAVRFSFDSVCSGTVAIKPAQAWCWDCTRVVDVGFATVFRSFFYHLQYSILPTFFVVATGVRSPVNDLPVAVVLLDGYLRLFAILQQNSKPSEHQRRLHHFYSSRIPHGLLFLFCSVLSIFSLIRMK